MDNNLSIIVFSKGRPMQLHAYLESMLMYSEIEQENISVLYCESEGIDYSKVIKNFSKVNWIVENKFENDLRALIDKAGDFIMFGCDDVVFNGKFDIEKAKQYLSDNSEVFGFSMRLGKNIQPIPEDAVCNNNIMKWNWENSTQLHYDYPWELDCTLYRKEDVIELLSKTEKAIKNPNYYEGIVNKDNKSVLIKRKHMACFEKRNSAIVITVNRVQDSYQNGFDDSLLTDVDTLNRLYNDDNNTLDIEAISKIKSDKVHVESEFFILRDKSKNIVNDDAESKKNSGKISKIKKFYKKSYNYVERRLYRAGFFKKKAYIATPERTLKKIISSGKSFVRFSDGDIDLMMGNTTPAQYYDAELVARLKSIMNSTESGLLVGVPYYYLNYSDNFTDYMKVHSVSIADRRKFLLKNVNPKKHYIDSGITQLYPIYESYDFEMHYKLCKKLLKNKDITIICGEGIFDLFKNKLFEVCNSVEYQYEAGMNAYKDYSDILGRACNIDKNRIVCVALGSTAKPLVYDLYKKGYTVWDVGHLFKDYDYYMRKKPKNDNEILQFYMPD